MINKEDVNIAMIDWKEVNSTLDQFLNDNNKPLDEIEWFRDLILYNTPKGNVYTAFVDALVNWFSMLALAVEAEQYLIAAKFRDVILMEKNNMIELLKSHYIYTDLDLLTINTVINKGYGLYLTKNDK
jgi:hypothetical protein